MTSTAKNLLWIAGGVIAWGLFRKSVAGGNLVFFPDRITSFKFEGLTPVFVAGIRVQNTSNQSFTLNSLAGTVASDNVRVGNFSSFSPQTIQPNSQKVFYVDIRLQALSIVNDLIKAFQNANFRKQLTIDGVANIDGLQTDFKLTYNVGL